MRLVAELAVEAIGAEPESAPDAVAVTTLGATWIDRAGELLARSFVDEPGFAWTLGGTAERRRRVLAPSFRASLRGRQRSIELHGAFVGGQLVGVGVRFPPGRWPPSRWESLLGLPWRTVGMLVRARASRRSVQRLITNPSMEHLHVDYPPHWYLWLMGVHPAYRRHGVASALARHVTRLADEAGVGCYLETFGDGAEALYRGFGFEVRDHFVIAADAPTGRTMWREPQSLVVASPQS